MSIAGRSFWASGVGEEEIFRWTKIRGMDKDLFEKSARVRIGHGMARVMDG